MKKILAISVLVGFGGLFVYSYSPNDESRLIQDRLWVDHLGQNERDKVSLFALLSEPKLGIFEESSAFQGNFDLVSFSKASDTVTLVMLQTGTTTKVTFEASKCSEPNFDYCLELKGSPRGPSRYYSRKGWELDSLDEVFTKPTLILQSFVDN